MVGAADASWRRTGPNKKAAVRNERGFTCTGPRGKCVRSKQKAAKQRPAQAISVWGLSMSSRSGGSGLLRITKSRQTPTPSCTRPSPPRQPETFPLPAGPGWIVRVPSLERAMIFSTCCRRHRSIDAGARRAAIEWLRSAGENRHARS